MLEPPPIRSEAGYHARQIMTAWLLLTQKDMGGTIIRSYSDEYFCLFTLSRGEQVKSN